jgi:hypothetical protein
VISVKFKLKYSADEKKSCTFAADFNEYGNEKDINELHIEHRNFFTIESEKMIVSALNKFLGI